MPPPYPLKPPCPGSDGAHECPSPSPPFSSHGQGRLVTPLVITASFLVFLSLVSLSIYCFVRRRRRRRQQSLLAAQAATANPGAEGGAAAPNVEAVGPEVDDGGEDDDEVVLHHAWHIRTEGLDEAAIESIALTRYRAGAGMLGAADCSVCLAEFRDGELLRLLPKCGHAFHVPCIGTWLRAHVNCPLCRADIVLDPAAAEDSDRSAAGASADTNFEQASNNNETLDREQPDPGQQQNEQHEVRVQIDQRDQSSSPEPQRRHPGSRVQNFRRVASMDSSIVSAAEAPEDEQRSKENQGNGDAACCKVSSGSGRLYHMKRSLSGGGRGSLVSWHWRTRSPMLPA